MLIIDFLDAAVAITATVWEEGAVWILSSPLPCFALPIQHHLWRLYERRQDLMSVQLRSVVGICLQYDICIARNGKKRVDLGLRRWI